MTYPLSVKIALTSAFVFFLSALLTGIWKYALMSTTEKSQSRYYVDIAHRSSFLYAYAALLLAVFAYLSQLDDWINSSAVVAPVVFYAAAIVSYIYQGLLNKSKNQIRSSKQKEAHSTPIGLVHFFMMALIVAEVGGAIVLGYGALTALWV